MLLSSQLVGIHRFSFFEVFINTALNLSRNYDSIKVGFR